MNRIDEPLIRTAEMAKAMFLALEKDINPLANPTRWPLLEVKDGEDFWQITRTVPPPVNGGGQLTMQIAKCDGAIVGVYLSR